MLNSFDLADIIGSILVLAILAYTAYRVLAIRRESSGGPYRNQALGIGLVSAALAVYFLEHLVYSYVPTSNTTEAFFGPPGLPTFILILLLLFYVVDSFVLTVRRSDPLLRDNFHWRRVRLVLWPLIVCSGVLVSVENFVFQMWEGYAPGTPPWWVPAVFVSMLGSSVVNAIMSPLAWWRTKDPILRRQIVWFGPFVILFWLGQLWFSYSPRGSVEGLFVFYALFLASGYCLLRSAGSLALPHSLSGNAIEHGGKGPSATTVTKQHAPAIHLISKLKG